MKFRDNDHAEGRRGHHMPKKAFGEVLEELGIGNLRSTRTAEEQARHDLEEHVYKTYLHDGDLDTAILSYDDFDRKIRSDTEGVFELNTEICGKLISVERDLAVIDRARLGNRGAGGSLSITVTFLTGENAGSQKIINPVDIDRKPSYVAILGKLKEKT